jgi:hypothetical protein
VVEYDENNQIVEKKKKKKKKKKKNYNKKRRKELSRGCTRELGSPRTPSLYARTPIGCSVIRTTT